MRWFTVDGARDYLAARGPRPSRKTLYGMVKRGMRVARRGDTGKRLLFCEEWIDAFLESRAPERRPVEITRKIG